MVVWHAYARDYHDKIQKLLYFFIQGHPPGTEQAGGPLITK